MVTEDFHLLVSLHVVGIQDIQIVEWIVERVADLKLQINDRIKNTDFFKVN